MIQTLSLLNLEQIKVFYKNTHLFSEIDSTNSALIRMISQKSIESGTCVIAECQTDGKGRRGKKWVSPFGENLYISLLWDFNGEIDFINGLSLVIGISIAEVLEEMKIFGVTLKWPNDILIGNKKLAGILIEIIEDPKKIFHVIIGIGLNVNMDCITRTEKIDQPWTSLKEICGYSIDRTELILTVLSKIQESLKRFEKDGFVSFRDRWEKFDNFIGRDVEIKTDDKVYEGIYQGISSRCQIQILIGTIIKEFNAGEVSLRTLNDSCY